MKQKILAEIERLLNHTDFNNGDVEHGYDIALLDIKRYINSLPEEPVSKDLGEAAEEAYPDEKVVLARGNTCLSCGKVKRDAFKAGAKWMAEQGEIHDSIVWQDEDNKLFIQEFVKDHQFQMADKVTVQVRKKED